jgi:hypothetical protein
MSDTNAPINFRHERDYRAEWNATEDRKVLFTVTKLDHDEHGNVIGERTVEHTMPNKPNAGLALEYLKRARRMDPDIAMSWLIEAAVGPEGYDDLTDELANPDIADPLAILRDLTARIQKVALGGLEAPKA